MGTDSTIRVSFVLSCGVHAAVFSLFSFVIILDLGSAMPPVEITYIGSSNGRVFTRNAVFRKIAMETPPLINLPDRELATESIISGADEKISLAPTVAGKVALWRIYARSKPDSEVLDAAGQPVRAVSPVRLNMEQKYTLEGKLTGRKIIIQPPNPDYPQWAVKGGLEADMKLRVTVNPQGVVEKVESVQTTGYPRIDLVTSRYIKQWRFESRDLDTESETGVIEVKFRLK